MKTKTTRERQWSLRPEVQFTYKLFWKFVKTSVWLLARNHNDTYPNFIKLASRIERLLRLSGPSFTVSYLKEAHRLITKTLAGELPVSQPEIRVAMRRGLPLIIPGALRLLIERGDRVVIKIVLTFISIFRVIPSYPKLKLETITAPFKGSYKTLQELPLVYQWLERKFLRGNPAMKYFRQERTPFTVGRKLLRLTTAGPNSSIQIVGYPLDALAFNENPALLKWYKVFAMNTSHKNLLERLGKDIDHWECQPPKVLQTSNFKNAELFRRFTKSKVNSTTEDVKLWYRYRTPETCLRLGKLSLKKEAAGKVRVFAIVDAWTQSLLRPLHQALFDILRNIKQDGTFDQLAPVKLLMDKGLKDMYSFDLSAATDRLPIDIQVDLLSLLFDNRETAEAWKGLLVDRDYHLDSSEFPESTGTYRYSVGQPMGALSSWAMLALTHHMIVQIAALRVGFTTWFEDYAVLGDDLVIANKSVAQAYLVIMRLLGVDINLSKSVQSSIGACEFAKKLIVSGEDFSPFGVKELFEFIRSPRHFKDWVLNNSLFSLNLEVVDYTNASQFLQTLIEDKRLVSNQKWLNSVRSTWWDLLGLFGLNLTKDLSPSITTLAIDSLNSEESGLFDNILRNVLKQRISRGWLAAFEKDVSLYTRIRRSLSLDWYIASFPSTDNLLDLYSSDMVKHLYRPYVDLDKMETEELLTLAFSDLSYLSYPFELSKMNRASKSKSLELSRDILRALARDRPHLLLKVMRSSQAFSEPK
uniref:RNA-dependent RNA polymerase n=1 Tax=Plasmopara viticola lesion associated mitovirus 25 TaxID=2719451 RepID=A0A6G9RV60_9VIRU|nr:RNA-dependent RNA polymerase [Plasmopara viticola lesion associated mitovirus 25]